MTGIVKGWENKMEAGFSVFPLNLDCTTELLNDRVNAATGRKCYLFLTSGNEGVKERLKVTISCTAWNIDIGKGSLVSCPSLAASFHFHIFMFFIPGRHVFTNILVKLITCVF